MFNNMYTSPEKYQSSKKRNSKEDIKNDKRHQPTDYRNKRHRQHILWKSLACGASGVWFGTKGTAGKRSRPAYKGNSGALLFPAKKYKSKTVDKVCDFGLFGSLCVLFDFKFHLVCRMIVYSFRLWQVCFFILYFLYVLSVNIILIKK